MRNKFNFQFNFQQLMNKNVLKVFLPGKWTLALFLIVFIICFAWGTTFDKNSNPVDGPLVIGEYVLINSAPFPWYPDEENFANLLMGEAIPIIGQFNLFVWNFVYKSLWLGVHYNTLNFSFEDYASVLADYYCLLISIEAGILFSVSLFRRKVKKDQLWNYGNLILYRGIIMLIIVFIFYYW